MRRKPSAARELPAAFEHASTDWPTVVKTITPVELWICLILGVVIFLVYLPGIAIPYYGDDLGWIDAASSPWRHFVQVNTDGWYRPLQAGIYTVVQKYFGLSTTPIHVLMFLVHALLCVLVVKATADLGYGGVAPLLAGVFMALSQANAFALLSNDTLSQVAGTFFGCLSLWALASPHLGRRALQSPAGVYLLSVAAFAVALFFKETTSSFLPLLLCVLALINYRRSSFRVFLTRSLAMSLPYISVFLAYFAVRVLVGANAPSFGPGGYHFRVGGNVIINVLMDMLALVVPTSSVVAFEAFANRSIVALALIAAGALLLIAVIGYGLWLKRRDWKPAVIFILMVGSVFPMVMMNHISELYVYNTTPFFSMLAGIGLGAVLESARPHRHLVFALGAGILVLFASHLAAIRDKALMMQENGERAVKLLERLGPYFAQVPRRGALVLVNPPAQKPEYAVYVMNGFNVLQYGEPYIKQVHGREDIEISIIDASELARARKSRDALILGLDGDSLRVIAKPGGM